MSSAEMMNLKDIFENPFEEVNANVLDSKQIVEYWCSPFTQGILNNFDEHKFRTCKLPIILQGSRGSGKTTILKYFSYPAQIERAERNNKSLLNVIMEEMEVGFYYRFDESFISTFKAAFENIKQDGWTEIFNNYLELTFCKYILEMYNKLIDQGKMNINNISQMIMEILSGTNLRNYVLENSIECLYNTICEQISYINEYKNRSLFVNEDFKPNFILDLFKISGSIVKQLKNYIPELKNVLFVFLFDEFENLTYELQKRFNSLIKFTPENISLRFGRRREGNITNETINNTEYLRENHDYFLASLDYEIEQHERKNLKEYFLGIAKKRLWNIQKKYNGKYDLLTMFGDKEDLDSECIDLCKGRDIHLQYVLHEDIEILNDNKLCNQIIQIIRNEKNPIAETINALWVIRGQKDKIKTAKQVAKAMNSFFSDKSNKNDIDVQKYSDDYNNKYRYAITVYLCSVYKKDKLYYGFNAICYLSNGNPRTFINLCRAIISDACFFEKDNFLETGIISKEIQSKAIHNFSKSEFDGICSIIDYGKNIRTFILNIGNYFSFYHKDKKLRYPETNQFYFDELCLFENDREIIKTALSWSMIIRKKKTQRLTAGNNKKGDLYQINKIFNPIFNISYRTRGGFNLPFNNKDIHNMLNEIVTPNIVTNNVTQSSSIQKNKNSNDKQLSLFDVEGFSDEN